MHQNSGTNSDFLNKNGCLTSNPVVEKTEDNRSKLNDVYFKQNKKHYTLINNFIKFTFS